MSDLVEEDLEDSEGEAAEEGEEAVAREVNCILETGAAALDVLSQSLSLENILQLVQLGVDFSHCSAEGEYEGKQPKEPEPGGPTCNECFAAGTPIHTNHGETPIEQIDIGDEVESRDSKTGTIETRTVTALTEPHHDDLLEIHVEGEKLPLRPSTHHPFWVRRGEDPNGHWILSGQLRVGDLLQTIDDQWRRIAAIVPLGHKETVYNFTVDRDHDYFVGQTGFLVHNTTCPCGPLDWSRTNWKGETATDHVNLHGLDIPTRDIHGVFADDPIATTNRAWEIAVQTGIKPTLSKGNLVYDVPYPEAGLLGGIEGKKKGNPILNIVRIITEQNCNKVVSAFPY